MKKNKVIKYTRPNIINNIKNVSRKIKRGASNTNTNIIRNSTNKPTSNTNIVTSLPKANRKKVFIIGGGPSLTHFDFNLLKDFDTIAVNKSIDYVESAKYFITMDYTFLSKASLSIQEINNKVEQSYFVINEGESYIKSIDDVYTDTRTNMKYSKLNQFDGIIKSKLNYDFVDGFGKTLSNFCHGNNSGYCALQLAILLGYEEIYLLGFDLNINDKKSHFHSAYPQNISTIRRNFTNYKASFAKSFQLSKNNNIYNCSYKSSLNDFIKHVPFHKAIQGEDKIMPKVKLKGDLRDLMTVGYYTINTPYESEANKLIASLNKLNLLHDIVGVKNLGSWQANTRFKAQFMLDMMEKHPDKNLLYVDVDAIIHSRPILFQNYDCDVAVRWQDFRWRKNECLSGTIFMKNNDKTKKLCKIWSETNESEGKNANTFEQWNLGKAIEQMQKTDGLIAKNLPPEYTFIFDSMRKIYPNAKPIIEHFQASRRYRSKV